MTAGPYVPEAVLEHPDAVIRLHRDFLRAGSDVMLAFTYYAHREKLRLIGKEGALEEMNPHRDSPSRGPWRRRATRWSPATCATPTSTWTASRSPARMVRAMFDEQVGWAVDEGVDFIVAETISYVSEALLALDAINEAGLPAVINLAIFREPLTREGLTPAEACKRPGGRGRRRGRSQLRGAGLRPCCRCCAPSARR